MPDSDIHPKMYLYRRIVEAKRFIDECYHQKIDLNNISNQAHFSKYHFLRLFKNAFGLSPNQYLREVRIAKAKKLLQKGHSVKLVCFDVGFESIPSFIHLFKKHVHATPYQYVKKIQEERQQQQRTPLSFIPNCFAEQYGWTE